ncbi:MAG: MFS transporter [Spirochaetaceae bacterium]|nr:MFS transporter [Spirochaetaceae bacterium]
MRPARAEPRWAQFTIASLGVLLASADTYVVVLALPDIMTGVGLGVDELQRATPIVSAFLLGYVVVLPLIGRLSDLHGRVPVLTGCFAVFALGSLCTASGQELGLVVTGRALQGVGAGGLVPATLALVADRWEPERRGLPLGLVGAVQEVGTVLGPLFGGAVLAVSGWRTIFWVNLAGAVLLGAVLLALTVPAAGARRRVPVVGAVLGLLGLTGLVLAVTAPSALVADVTFGAVYVPTLFDAAWTSPLAIVTAVLVLAAAVRLSDRASLSRLLTEADLLGAILVGLALTGVVLAFATADPSRQAASDQAPLLLTGSVVCIVLFVVRQRHTDHPLVPLHALNEPAAKGALAVNFFVGAALVAALVNVPIFARATRYPDSQLGASLVLVQLLVALPVGAVLGGWLCGRTRPRVVAAAGMALAAVGFVAMAQWDSRALDGPGSTAALLATGLGFGLTIAPVNVALLAATRAAVHGVATALVVVARTVGMLVGLSALTAVGLRVFYAEQRAIGTPLTLCPTSPGDCPVYEAATRAALIIELQAIFWSAALCAAIAALLALLLLAPSRDKVSAREIQTV